MGPLGAFAITLGVFHLSEFLLTCLLNRTELSRQCGADSNVSATLVHSD